MSHCDWCGEGPPPIDDRGWCLNCRQACDLAWQRVLPLLPLNAREVDVRSLRREITILIGARLISGRGSHYVRPTLAEGLAWVYGNGRHR